MLITAALQGLAGNPELPETLVRRLVGWQRGSGEVAERDDLGAATIEEIIDTGDHWLLHSLALNRRLPDPVRLRLAQHRDDAVRAALALRADGPREVFSLLAGDPDRLVREWLAQNKHVPADIRARLADDPDPEIRATLAQWWNGAPEPVRRKLLTDPEQSVRAAACSTYFRFLPHPVPPADLVPALLDDPATRAGSARHAVLTPETLARLAGDPDHKVRRELARHPDLPAETRDRLARDSSVVVQVAVFGREDLPEHLRQEIHENLERRTAVPVNPFDRDRDDDALIRAVEDNAAIDELRQSPLPWVTANPLPHVTSRYIGFRVAAARAAGSLPLEAVRTMLADEELDVRATVVSHAPHVVDVATAEQIEREWSREFRKNGWRPADSYPFPPESLRRFATDPNPGVRALAAGDPDLPTELLTGLATGPDPGVRRAVAGHARLPVAVLIALLEDESEHVVRAAASSPALPVTAMEEILDRAGL
ncbi:HEAT repeat domain-containing protein [Actinoplanes derwentensis]|nr:HEAT repeat domain-containing protein [Actinoplanes derwentensis]